MWPHVTIFTHANRSIPLQMSGLTILVLSIWMLLDPTFYISMAQDEPSYYSGICLLFLAGMLFFIVGFLGCFGAYNESQKLLVLVRDFFFSFTFALSLSVSPIVWFTLNNLPPFHSTQFFCGLLLILVGQIAAGVWAYSNSDKLEYLLRYTVSNTVRSEYGKPDSKRTDSLDAIQSGVSNANRQLNTR